MLISSTLINWYLEKKRNLPWRNTSDAYKIWVSEIILQQTRVAQGTNYYFNFLNNFPDVQTLAIADIQDIMKVWQGLGYYSRARNMHQAAKDIVDHHNASFPPSYHELIKIKGIGEYTASAIGSFAFNLPLAVVDGNVNRFIARYFGIHDPVNSTSGIKAIRETAAKIIDTLNPALHNQAIMEFGALQCTSSNPQCDSCPFLQDCYAYNHGEVKLIPAKIKPAKPRNRYFNYYIFLLNDYIFMNRRSKNDIWKGLYDFPLHETPENSEEIVPEQFLRASEKDYKILNISEIYAHQLTHQKIYARFYAIRIEKYVEFILNETVAVERKEIRRIPVPKLIDNYISTLERENYFSEKIGS